MLLGGRAIPPAASVVLAACSVCDMPQYVTVDGPYGSFRCWCCGAVVHRTADRAPEETLALAVAAAICFVLGNLFPVVAIEANGTAATSTLIGAAHALYSNGMAPVAMVVLLMTVLLPAIELVCLCGLLLGEGRPCREGKQTGEKAETHQALRNGARIISVHEVNGKRPSGDIFRTASACRERSRRAGARGPEEM